VSVLLAVWSVIGLLVLGSGIGFQIDCIQCKHFPPFLKIKKLRKCEESSASPWFGSRVVPSARH
jgi:hypothetical protein